MSILEFIKKYTAANRENIHRGLARIEMERKREVEPRGQLHATIIKHAKDGTVISRIPLGLISVNLVTTAGMNFVVDAFQNLVEAEAMKYHASGTGVTAEAIGDTALVTEVDTRVAGTQIEGASANIYKTVATLNYTATRSITEHGIFSAPSAGVLLDRSKFTAIAVDTSTSIQFTYELTFPAGG